MYPIQESPSGFDPIHCVCQPPNFNQECHRAWGLDILTYRFSSAHAAFFDAIAHVLNALQEHGEELIDITRELKQDKGEGKPGISGLLAPRVAWVGEGRDVSAPHLPYRLAPVKLESSIAHTTGMMAVTIMPGHSVVTTPPTAH